MTLAHARTTDHSLRATLAAAFAHVASAAAAAFAWAERSQHSRLGSAFLPPELLREIRMSTGDSFGLPADLQRDLDRR
jgi:hypothetical protein